MGREDERLWNLRISLIEKESREGG